MILYKKKFQLGSGVLFSDYIRSLDKIHFPPYTLLIRKMPASKDLQMEIAFTSPINPWGRLSSFDGQVLLKECTIKYLQGENSFVLQASTGTGNFLKALFFIGKVLFLLFMILSVMIFKDIYGDIFIFIFIILLFSPPSPLAYFRERSLLDRIGSIASEL
jgi:hypothetical protein